MNGLTCFKAPVPEQIFLDILMICLDQERVSSIVRPRDFKESTLLISLPSICARKEVPALVCSLCRDRIILRAL